MRDICFWSVGDGDYAYILQTLVHSFHAVGIEGDFHVFSDRNIHVAVNHNSVQFDKRGCIFKFKFLQQQVKNWDYRYFIYLDADTLFLRKPSLLLVDLLAGDPLHLFFESDCTIPQARRQNWWGCPLMEYVRLMRECGVSSPHIYNINGGFFIVQKYAIDIICELALDFAEYAFRQRYLLPDEPAWAYALHMLSKIPEQHLLSRYRNVWCSDWEGVFKEHLPDGQPWVFRDFMSHVPYTINPSIVHAIRSKDLLIKRSAVI
jgi:hypothetical protein